jgi:hypothetical protein
LKWLLGERPSAVVERLVDETANFRVEVMLEDEGRRSVSLVLTTGDGSPRYLLAAEDASRLAELVRMAEEGGEG